MGEKLRNAGASMGSYGRATFSLSSVKSRMFRVAGTCLAYMVGTGQVTQDMNWESFIGAFSSPMHVIGMLGVVFIAGSTGGNK